MIAYHCLQHTNYLSLRPHNILQFSIFFFVFLLRVFFVWVEFALHSPSLLNITPFHVECIKDSLLPKTGLDNRSI